MTNVGYRRCNCFFLYSEEKILDLPVRKPFKNVRSHSRSSSACDGMSQHKSFEGVTAVGLPVDDVEDFLVKLLTLRKAGRPVVAGATSIFGQENVFLNKKGRT
jgi:hypothetical protein